MSKRVWVVVGVSVGVVLVAGGTGGGIWWHSHADQSQLAAYTKSTPLSLVEPSRNYVLMNVEPQPDLFSASYDLGGGKSVSITQQPKPTSKDLLEKATPTDSYMTNIGQAQLFPNDRKDPWVLVETPTTWVIITPLNNNTNSRDLKAVALTLHDIK